MHRPFLNTFRYTKRSVLPIRLAYSPQYNLNLGEHIFPCVKYAMIHDRLVKEGIAEEADFVDPPPISDEDLLLVHDRAWIGKLKNGKLSLAEAMRLEIPVSEQMLSGMWRMAGGTRLAAEDALRTGVGFNIGGGFHHAFADHGEGFCAINDVAAAVRSVCHRGLIERAMIIDCDVHHGNGTASIFHGDDSVFTFSIHQSNVYPAVKPPSDLDIELEDNTGDREYLSKLCKGLDTALSRFKPDLVVYVAGADPFMEDQLGGLLLTMDGLRQRDEMVLRVPHPVAVVLAGGYSFRVADIVAIHCNTVKAAAQRQKSQHSD